MILWVEEKRPLSSESSVTSSMSSMRSRGAAHMDIDALRSMKYNIFFWFVDFCEQSLLDFLVSRMEQKQKTSPYFECLCLIP